MISSLHVISGLPRSGSTLLSGILRQNPRFSAAVTSPVAMLCGALHAKMTGGEFDVFLDDDRREALLKGVFDSYYHDALPGHVIFDTNRTWTAKASLISRLYPDARIICCVRDVGWIIDSVERMLSKNPLHVSRIFNNKPTSSVYSRVENLMNAENGLIGKPWRNLREAWYGELAGRLIIVPYDHLVDNPGIVIRRLYEELGEPLFEHDFDNVIYDEPAYDSLLGMPGLHAVRQKVAHEQRPIGIPPELFEKYTHINFWKKPEANHRNVTIL